MKTVIVGRPNVGKSSLLNALIGMERAIVTDVPGTTRDVIEEQIVVEGIPLRLLDTAGLRAAEDAVEQIGVARTQRHLADAELVLAVFDGAAPLTPEDEDLIVRLRNCAAAEYGGGYSRALQQGGSQRRSHSRGFCLGCARSHDLRAGGDRPGCAPCGHRCARCR